MEIKAQKVFDLGTGIYTTNDVATILGLPQAKVRRWLKQYWNLQFGKMDFAFSDGNGRELVTNFYTLIEFYTFYQLREMGVSIAKIVYAHGFLEKLHKTHYPFATSKILTDGRTVLFTGEDGEVVHADETLQISIKEVLTPFFRKIDFNSEELAERFFPMGRDREVVIDPHRQFGQPVVGNTNILTETVFNLYRGGESSDFIARIYNLTEDQVKDAINYHRNAA